MRSVLCHCQTLREALQTLNLIVTDARIAHWRVALRNLTWLEVKSCPHMRFAYPDVNWSRPPDKLRTLRIQPRGAPENWGFANSERDMRVSARHLHQLSFAKKSAIAHLCLGCEFAAPEGENKKLGVGGNVGGYRSETVWDLRGRRRCGGDAPGAVSREADHLAEAFGAVDRLPRVLGG